MNLLFNLKKHTHTQIFKMSDFYIWEALGVRWLLRISQLKIIQSNVSVKHENIIIGFIQFPSYQRKSLQIYVELKC